MRGAWGGDFDTGAVARGRLGRSAEAARLWQLDVLHAGAINRSLLDRSICHWVGDGRRVGRPLLRADEPCPKGASPIPMATGGLCSPHVKLPGDAATRS
jgi:hypothetical protein